MERQKSKGTWGTRIFILFLIVVIAVLAFLYITTKQELDLVTSPEAQAELEARQTQELVESVSRHFMLPEDEVPTTATIVDAEALIAEQEFYRGSQDGDQVLIYTQNEQAIIYSPSRDIIVNVGPVVLGEESL